MSVLKKYNENTDEWEVVVVGEKGDPGIIYSETPPADTSVLWYDESEGEPSMEEIIAQTLQSRVISETVVSGTSFTLTDQHAGGIVLFTADSDITVSIDESQLLSRARFTLVQDGLGAVILDIAAANRRGGDRTAAQFDAMDVYWREDGLYQVIGGTTP